MLLLVFTTLAVIANIALAQRKRRRPGPWIVGAVLTGLFSTAILAFISPLGTRECPACKSRIPDDATRCRFCQADLTIGL